MPFVAWMAKGTGRPATGRARLWALIAGACFMIDLGMWHAALHYTSAANATLLVTLAPIWVAVVSVIWMGARIRRRFWVTLRDEEIHLTPLEFKLLAALARRYEVRPHPTLKTDPRQGSR